MWFLGNGNQQVSDAIIIFIRPQGSFIKIPMLVLIAD